MRAIVITEPGGPEVLRMSDVATPDPGSHQIRVRVHAAGVNRADLLQRRGNYPAPPGAPANILGLEYAGVVDATGDQAARWRVGDRVMGIVGGGAYAEYVVVHEDEALPIPASLSFDEAAAIPEAFITAYDALHARGRVQRGDAVLIHAVASGVGTAASQLARELDCRVFGTARTAAKLARVSEFGVEVAIDVSTQDWVQVVRDKTDGRGVNVIIDLVGGDYLVGNVESLAVCGRIVLVGLVAGRAAQLDMGQLLRKRATLVGTVLRARSLAEKIEVAQLFARDVLGLFEAKRINPVIDQVLPIDQAGEAHRIMEANRNVGKIVLKV